MDKDKLIHQLFIGKVSEVIGFDKTTELLKESIEAINETYQKNEQTESSSPAQSMFDWMKLSNKAYHMAKTHSYNDFVTWWDSQI